MMANDGAQLRGVAYELFPEDLMQELRAWAAERHCDDLMAGLMLLVAHLGQAGLVVADCFYRAGCVEGAGQALAAWRAALRQPRGPEEEDR